MLYHVLLLNEIFYFYFLFFLTIVFTGSFINILLSYSEFGIWIQKLNFNKNQPYWSTETSDFKAHGRGWERNFHLLQSYSRVVLGAPIGVWMVTFMVEDAAAREIFTGASTELRHHLKEPGCHREDWEIGKESQY